jgi:hypothetical protein
MRSRDKSGRLFYPILQTAGFAGFFCRRSHPQGLCILDDSNLWPEVAKKGAPESTHQQ